MREDCDYLAGRLSQKGQDGKRLEALKHLTSELSRVGRKVGVKIMNIIMLVTRYISVPIPFSLA